MDEEGLKRSAKKELTSRLAAHPAAEEAPAARANAEAFRRWAMLSMGSTLSLAMSPHTVTDGHASSGVLIGLDMRWVVSSQAPGVRGTTAAMTLSCKDEQPLCFGGGTVLVLLCIGCELHKATFAREDGSLGFAERFLLISG